jgi:replicative DNA helicase
MAIIGSCLLDRDAIIVAATLLSSDDLDAFYQPIHKAIYHALLDLYAKRIPADLVTINSALERLGMTEQVGGIAGLEQFMAATSTSMHVEYYCRAVLERWADRLMIEAGQQLSTLGYSKDDQQAKFAKAQKIYDRAFNRKQTASLVTMQQASEEFLESFFGDGDVGAATGFDSLDLLLGGGLQKGDLVMIAALTSGGKTAFICQAAMNIAKRGQQALVVSLEMKARGLMARFVAIQSGIPSEKIRQPKRLLTDAEQQQVADAAGEISDLPLRIDQEPNVTIADIRSRALALQAETGSLDVVFVDYIQLISAPGVSEENRAREVGKFSRSLKILAGELNCPVVALSQFSRAASSRGGVPQLSDLKESSSLEQDADVVLILYRPDLHDKDAPKGKCEVHIAKQRQGPLGSVLLDYAPDTGRWYDASGYRTPFGYGGPQR